MTTRMFEGEHKVCPYDFIVFVVGANLVFALLPIWLWPRGRAMDCGFIPDGPRFSVFQLPTIWKFSVNKERN